MSFRLFDMYAKNFFTCTTFVSIVDENVIPNYKKIVIRERKLWKTGGRAAIVHTGKDVQVKYVP